MHVVTIHPMTDYGKRDQFLDAQAFDAAKAAELAERLETLHGSDAERAQRATYLDLLGVEPGKHVLEVGCGNGWVLREIARRVAPGGRAVGLDASGELLALATTQAAEEDVRVELRPGDARELPYDQAEFDIALAPLVLLHVPDADRVIPELVRVVRPGGRVGVLERDNESFILNHPDRELTRRIVQTGTDQTAINAWVGRRLPGMLSRAGLLDVQIKPLVILERRFSAPTVRFILRWVDVAADLGAINGQERQRWLEQFQEQEADDGFLIGVTHLFAWGTRPTA